MSNECNSYSPPLIQVSPILKNNILLIYIYLNFLILFWAYFSLFLVPTHLTLWNLILTLWLTEIVLEDDDVHVAKFQGGVIL